VATVALVHSCAGVSSVSSVATVGTPAVETTTGLAAAPLAPGSVLAPAAPTTIAPSAPDPEAMLQIARIAGAFDLSVAPGVVDHLVRWQVDARDTAHQLGEELLSLAEDTSSVLPDIRVLTLSPVAHTESSGFGWRDDPIRHTRSFHSGTDFRGKRGTRIVAAGDGIVRFAGRMGGYGNMISIDHGGGVITRYAHLRRLVAKKDSAVTAGQAIGELGSTGRATGPHLHFEVRLDGAPVSPITAMAIASLQRESPLLGRLAALSLSPELQSAVESDVDPPKQRARPAQRSPRNREPARACGPRQALAGAVVTLVP
jgi:murein DD-endopeptidase MepM/ murein hydrolase activator NlpD